MNRLWSVAQAGLLFLDPETAHEASLRTLEAGVYPRQRHPNDPRLKQTAFGLDFPNPIGIAAGYDKDARVYNALFAMGFGFAEAGTLTPGPQPGNARPRVFRLPGQHGIINRLGFNNGGHTAALKRIAASPPQGILGINIGANKNNTDPVADYREGVRVFAGSAAYLAVNISSPNTRGLRDLQQPDRLSALLDAVMAERLRVSSAVPILVKLAPDLHDDDIPAIANVLLAHRVDGAILTNTTLARDGVSPNFHRGEAGGLSGSPLHRRSTRVLARFHIATEGRLPLIGVGGINSGQTALAKIRAGACLLQLYTGLIYEGAGLVSGIHLALTHEMDRSGLGLPALRGTEAEKWASLPV